MLNKVLDFSVSKHSSIFCPPNPPFILRDCSNTPGTYLLLQLQHRLLHLVKLLARGTAGSGSHRALGLLVVPWERRQAPVHLGGRRLSSPRDGITKGRPGAGRVAEERARDRDWRFYGFRVTGSTSRVRGEAEGGPATLGAQLFPFRHPGLFFFHV